MFITPVLRFVRQIDLFHDIFWNVCLQIISNNEVYLSLGIHNYTLEQDRLIMGDWFLLEILHSL